MEDILSEVLGSAVLAPPRGGGSALFVINLCASMAPIAVSGKTLPGLESYRLYQVARVEDGRPRHRLRLGFFNNESDADAVLESVRARYPTAFTTCLSDDDRKFARGFLPPALQDASDTAIVRTIHAVVDGLPPAKIAESAARRAAAPAPRPIAYAGAPRPTPVAAVARVAEEPIKATQRPAVKTSQPESVVTEISWSPPALTPVKVVSVDRRTNKASAPAPAATNNSTVAPSTAKLPAAKIVAARAPIAVRPIAAPKLPNAPRGAAVASAKNAAPAAPKLAPKAATPAAPVPAKPAPAKPMPAAAARTPAPSAPLTLERPKAVAAPATAAPTSNSAPFRVDRGIQIPQTGLSLAAEAPAPHPAQRPAAASAPKAPAVVAKPAQPSIAAKATPQAKAPVAPAKPAPAAKAAPHAPAAAKPAAKSSMADLDSTQTIRALTAAELNDANQPKWFVVQLAISEQAINLDTMPHLDIFAAYRLYSVATAGSGKILHSLRLGFFKEEVSAQAVTGYLKTFFASPSVVRISASEQLRFAEPVGMKPASAADKEEHKVIELSEVRDRIGKALEVVPTVTMAVEAPRKPVIKTAPKSAGTATKRAPTAAAKSNTTGKHRTLGEELMDEARQVILSESAIRKLPKNDSLLSKLVDKLKK